MRYHAFKIVLILCFWGISGHTNGNPDPKKILEATKIRFSSIHDFTAEVEIEINVDFINIPNKQAKVFYKYPDKLKFKSKSFIMIPRKGIGMMIFELLESEYSSIYIGQETICGRKLAEIKVIPLADQSDISLATLFIDPDENLIYFIEAITRKSGFFTSEFEYGNQAPLPIMNRIQFEVEKVGLPLKFLGNVKIEKSQMEEDAMGEVILRYRHYEVNRDLDQSLFDEEAYGNDMKDH